MTGTISLVPRPGAIGVFVDLPHGMGGFVDALKLPRDVGKWPEPGQTLRFEVLQHIRGQVRLWPLDPGFDEATQEIKAGWHQAKLRYPVGATLPARVVDVFPINREYQIRFIGDDSPRWSYAMLPWTGEPPVAGSVRQYRIVAHRDTTRRIMVTPVG